MDNQKPSIGRIVHYKSYGTPSGEYKPECRAAVIAELASHPDEEYIALCILNPKGIFFAHATHDEDKKENGTWHWPERV